MKYLSVCSGIEAASVAWGPLGWKPIAFAEIEPFPCAVLARHYPDVPNLGDMTKIDGAAYRGRVDVLVGGTPCQSFSVAGLRRGLSDERGNLTVSFVELADAISPRFVVWENVPGILSTRDNSFGCFLADLAAVMGSFSLQEPRESSSDGRALVVCLDPGAQSRGGRWTPNISDFPNDADVCSLSHVLETGIIPQRFFLSSAACAGILHRAAKRGRSLPKPLHEALELAARTTPERKPDSTSKDEN